MNLKGSKTEKNLKDAFAGESQANRRYLYFAAKARTLRTWSLRNGSKADSGTAVTAIVSPMALKTSIE